MQIGPIVTIRLRKYINGRSAQAHGLVAISNTFGTNSFCISAVMAGADYPTAKSACVSTGATLCLKRQLDAALITQSFTYAWVGDTSQLPITWPGGVMTTNTKYYGIVAGVMTDVTNTINNSYV